MQANRKNFIGITVLITLFVLIGGISYYHVQDSISILKYIFESSAKYLLLNYTAYHHSFKDFLFNTTSFQPGDTESGGHSLLYLFPLFVFCDLCGGLSLKLIYFFNIGASLIFLVLFYEWIRKSWNSQAAFFAAYFLGFSAVFQEIARSGSFVGFSLLIVLIWMLYGYHHIGKEKPFYFGIFGFLTVLLWYVYGVARPLTLVAFARAWWAKPKSRWIAFGLLTGAMVLFLTPAVIFIFEQRKDFHGPWHKLFIDYENILDFERGSIHRIFMKFLDNSKVFCGRMTGHEQIIDTPMRWLPHAHFLNRLLVVPMLIGIGRIFRLWKRPENLLLIFISFLIYLTPVLTSGGGPRRAVLYVIPTYCFIGLGCQVIIDWISRYLHSRAVKGLVILFLIGSIGAMLFSEMLFVRRNIISSRRDLGLLAFVDQIKRKGYSGDIFYLDPNRFYNADILHLALMEKGKGPFKVVGGQLQGRPFGFTGDYFVVSIGVSDDDIKKWSVRHYFNCSLLLESPLINLPDSKDKKWAPWRSYFNISPFRMYLAKSLRLRIRR